MISANHLRDSAIQLALALALLEACSTGDESPARADSGTAAAPSPGPGDPSKASPGWTVSAAGIGPVRAGMTVAEARAALGAAAALPSPSDSSCGFVTPAGWSPDVSMMIVSGRVARIDVGDTSFATDVGARVGDEATRIEQLYPGRVRVQPHKYTSGRYLIVPLAAGADSMLRLVFETDSSGHVTAFRAGRMPEVEWVERCG